jgi:glycosyltransferase involved in cell wall biosynthesis
VSRPTSRRVLYVAWAPFFSGAERALLLTIRALDKTRYTPFVIAGTEGEFASQIRAMGVPCQVISLKQLDRRRPLGGLISVASVLAAAVRHRVSLIHSNDMPSFQPGGYAARMLGIPAITHVRFPDKASGYEWFFRPGFSLALFVSHALMKDAVAEAPDVFDRRSAVLHDCVEPQETWSPEQVANCRHELRLPIDKVLVAIAGQVAEVKGIWDFVNAAQIVANRGSNALFVVLGDDLKTGGKTRREMEARVEALGLSSHFKFLGFRRDAPRVVQAFDIIVVPSHVEPLGNATLEAMAVGRPVIGSRVGGIPEMVVDTETGLLVPPSDPTTLADAIERLVNDRLLREQMSRAARARAGTAFGMRVHASALEAFYDGLSG